MMQISIVIVTYNPGKEVIKLLDALEKEFRMTDNKTNTVYSLIVVDNGSTEKLSNYPIIPALPAGRQLSNFKYIRNAKNFGFAKACNIGIRYALKQGADRVMLLNQDTEITKGFLEPLLNNSADIVSPVIRFRRSGLWVEDYGGRVNWWIGRTYHIESTNQPINQSSNYPINTSNRTPKNASLASKITGSPARSASTGQAMKQWSNRTIDYVSGCCMIVKRSVFETIGLFDERYFLYFEDVDFCMRAKRAGFRVAVELKSTIIHNLSEGGEKPFWQRMQVIKSNVLFINQWMPWYRRGVAYMYVTVLALRLFLIPKRADRVRRPAPA